MKVTSIKTKIASKILFLVLISCLLFLSLITRANQASPKQQEVAELSSEINVLKGAFFQNKNIKPLKRPFKSEGSFVYLPNKGLLWHTQKPINSLKLFANKGVYNIDEQGSLHKEAQLDNDFFLALFAADEKKLANFFTAKKLEKMPGTDFTCLALTPISNTMQSLFEKVHLCTTELSDGRKLPKKIALIEPKGNHTEINFELSTEQITVAELAYFE